MTPPELMLASLGSCAAFYAAQYLKARNLAETGVEVSVTADKLTQLPGSATSRSMSYARSPSPKTRTRASPRCCGRDRRGLGGANIRPGAIRCVHGHNHIYFPRDFRLFPSSVPITAATIQENRQAYLAINPSPEPSSDPSVCADRANDGLCSLDSQISHGPGLLPI